MQGAQRSAELTRQLLAIGRSQPLEPVAADLNKLAKEFTGLLRRSLPESIDINVVECAGLWSATIDPVRLENAILNLALNARDAMRGSGKLTLETANVTLDEHYAAENVGIRPGPYVSIAMSDTGTGMSPEVLAHCFEPFFTTKGKKGTGLGLSSVYGFVRQSKGHITINSELGHGAIIRLYFPRAECSPHSRGPISFEAEKVNLDYSSGFIWEAGDRKHPW